MARYIDSNSGVVFNGNKQFFYVVPGSVQGTQDSTGWHASLKYHADYDTYNLNKITRGTVSTALPKGNQPALSILSGSNALYVDKITYNVVQERHTSGSALTPGMIEIGVTLEEAGNMSDNAGVEALTVPPTYEVSMRVYQIPLENHLTRYDDFLAAYKAGSNRTFYDQAVSWKNGDIFEKAKIFKETVTGGGASTGINQFKDYCAHIAKGIFYKELFYPVFRRTSVTTTAPTVEECGHITSLPTGFGSMVPAGIANYRKVVDTAVRQGRSGAYHRTEEWEGSYDGFAPTLYGTTTEQQGNGAGAPLDYPV